MGSSGKPSRHPGAGPSRGPSAGSRGRLGGGSRPGPSPQELARATTWAAEHLSRCAAPDGLEAFDICEVAVHPYRAQVACCLRLRTDFRAPTRRRVALVDLDGHATRLLDLPSAQSGLPAWSRDGRLAVVGVQQDGSSVVFVLDSTVGGPPAGAAGGAAEAEVEQPSVLARFDPPGRVEECWWSPDGTALALQVAMPGAETSDVHGSGVVPGGGQPWRPRVLPAQSGRRVVTIWRPESERADTLSGPNVWELAWSYNDALLALTSDEPDEGAWYAAVLTRFDLRTGGTTTLLRPPHQLAQPRSSPDGTRWSVLSAVQSDRGLPAGVLLLSGQAADAEPVELATEAVCVNDHHWLDEQTIRYAGLRGLDTVVGHIDVRSGRTRTAWSGRATSGEYQPAVAAAQGGTRPPVMVLEDHAQPPCLGVLEDHGFRPVLRVDGAGPRHQATCAGRTEALSWSAPDGRQIQGLLTLPDGPGPHALVLHVHGGPTHAWRRTWAGRDPHTSALVARGYAVLRPNPRGSTGRGAQFAAAVSGDLGGLDVDDLLAGVDHLVGSGLADPARLGVIGISYGGFMACWLPCRTDMFAAAVARSPATDWVSQHLTSNIAAFDEQFLGGDPFDPASRYTTRSPLRYHDRINTPTLLTCGLLDLATPPSQAQQLHSALARRGVPTQLAIYPREGHGVRNPEAAIDEVGRMLAWFEAFMPPR